MSKYPAPTPRYVGPVKWYGEKVNKPIRRIVIHGTVSPCKPGMARVVARYFKITQRPASAHYVVDPTETLQCVYDSWVAYHAPPNPGSLGLELCDPVVGSITRWEGKNHRLMLDRAALLTAQLCLANDIPVRRIGKYRLRLGFRGITDHDAVSKAWGQTTHWDPGAFPWRKFIQMVRGYRDDLKKEAH